MTFSEGLFKFPIKVYDAFSVAKAIAKEDKKFDAAIADEIDDIEPEETDWVLGYIRIPLQEIKAWTDIFSDGKSVKQIADTGFEETMVITKTLGNHCCLWPRKKFEEEVDKFAEKYEKGIQDMVEEAFSEKKDKTPPRPRGFWNWKKI